MGETTGIAWTDHTFNPWIGCTRISTGCENCYAEKLVTGRMGLPVWGVDSERRVTSASYWKQPIRWNKAAQAAGVRRRVFCASLADVFEIAPPRNVAANVAMQGARARLWDLIEATPSLDWLLLTKRPQNIARCSPPGWLEGFPRNVWLGVTAEDQKNYAQRWPILANIPAYVRFISHEPAIGPLVIAPATVVEWYANGKAPERRRTDGGIASVLPDWVITGGESGPGARPYNPTWAKEVISQCKRAGLAAFVKQMGLNVLDFSGRIKDRKGGDPLEWPAELRVQEFPAPAPNCHGYAVREGERCPRCERTEETRGV